MDLIRPGRAIESRHIDDAFEALRQEVQRFRAPEIPGMPRFFGGAVGFLAYDIVRCFEPRIPNSVHDDLGVPDLYMMFTDVVLVFDNVRQTLKIIANVPVAQFASVREAYRSGEQKIEATIARLREAAMPPCLERPPPNPS